MENQNSTKNEVFASIDNVLVSRYSRGAQVADLLESLNHLKTVWKKNKIVLDHIRDRKKMLVKGFLPNGEMTLDEKARRGHLLIDVLKLHTSRTTHRIMTTWGDKTAVGIYEVAKRLVVEGE